jgi:hypothetical protein
LFLGGERAPGFDLNEKPDEGDEQVAQIGFRPLIPRHICPGEKRMMPEAGNHPDPVFGKLVVRPLVCSLSIGPKGAGVCLWHRSGIHMGKQKACSMKSRRLGKAIRGGQKGLEVRGERPIEINRILL